MNWTVVAYFLLLAAQVQGWFWDGEGEADHRSIVTACGGQARFTVLTSEVLRLEYGSFHDDKTFVVINRATPVPHFEVPTNDDNRIEIVTDRLRLSFSCGSGTFKRGNIEVTLIEPVESSTVTWDGSTTYDGNLLGTVRTLDLVDGVLNLDCDSQDRVDLHCSYGVASRSGFVVIDDTHTPRFTPSGGQVDGKDVEWPWVNMTHKVEGKAPPPPHNRYLFPTGKGLSITDGKTGKVLRGRGRHATSDLEARKCGFTATTDSEACARLEGCEWRDNGLGVNGCYYGSESTQDLYFFGHGHDYRAAVRDFALLAGRIPVPPRYSLGVWYSRYWAYSDSGQMDIVQNYMENNLPLDVLVTDMDWHRTFYKEGGLDKSGNTLGWTGFTWDRNLFPNSAAFLQWCKLHGLKNTLNIHPASGMQKWEERYEEVARFMGVNASAVDYIPFNATDPVYVDAWLHLVMKKLADEGIDTWWLDWQQGEEVIPLLNVNPTFWLNYLFYTDPAMWSSSTQSPSFSKKADHFDPRPMILHRWGGLGNHRMQLGFSGDVIPSWESLNLEVYFTHTAANVLYGYWSHDIGGHTQPVDAELYTRWVQFGILSPVFRTHCTKYFENKRSIWLYPPENFNIMRNFIQFRSEINPYLYTTSRVSYESSVSPLHPLYYDYPHIDEAYTYKHQYLLGDSLLVAPVGSPVGDNGLAPKEIFFPPGKWVGYFSAEAITGPLTAERWFTLREIPLYAKVGSIIPLRFEHEAYELGSAERTPAGLVLKAFVCDSTEGSGVVYDDDGKTVAYESDKGVSWTRFSYTSASNGNDIEFVISAADSSYKHLPKSRYYQIQLVGVYPAAHVIVDGESIPYGAFILSKSLVDDEPARSSWTYDGDSLSLLINLSPRRTDKDVKVEIATSASASSPSLCDTGIPGLLTRLFVARDLLDDEWGKPTGFPTQEDYSYLLQAAEAGKRITYSPSTIEAEVEAFPTLLQQAVDQIKPLPNLDPGLKAKLVSQLEG